MELKLIAMLIANIKQNTKTLEVKLNEKKTKNNLLNLNTKIKAEHNTKNTTS